MHQALDSPFSPPRLLYPSDAHVTKKRPPTTQEVGALNVVDRRIGGNAMQKLAVITIRDLEPGSPPFVVFGPYVSFNFHLIRISHTFIAREPERLSPSLRPSAKYS